MVHKQSREPKRAPKWSPIASKYPKMVQNGPKRAPTWSPNTSKMAQKCFQNGSKMSPKCNHPYLPLFTPLLTPSGPPKCSQNGPKMEPKMLKKCSKTDGDFVSCFSSIFHDFLMKNHSKFNQNLIHFLDFLIIT